MRTVAQKQLVGADILPNVEVAAGGVPFRGQGGIQAVVKNDGKAVIHFSIREGSSDFKGGSAVEIKPGSTRRLNVGVAGVGELPAVFDVDRVFAGVVYDHAADNDGFAVAFNIKVVVCACCRADLKKVGDHERGAVFDGKEIVRSLEADVGRVGNGHLRATPGQFDASGLIRNHALVEKLGFDG